MSKDFIISISKKTDTVVNWGQSEQLQNLNAQCVLRFYTLSFWNYFLSGYIFNILIHLDLLYPELFYPNILI